MDNQELITRYDQREESINRLLYGLFAEVERRRDKFDQSGRTNWALQCELAHAEQLLREVHNFLGIKE